MNSESIISEWVIPIPILKHEYKTLKPHYVRNRTFFKTIQILVVLGLVAFPISQLVNYLPNQVSEENIFIVIDFSILLGGLLLYIIMISTIDTYLNSKSRQQTARMSQTSRLLDKIDNHKAHTIMYPNYKRKTNRYNLIEDYGNVTYVDLASGKEYKVQYHVQSLKKDTQQYVVRFILN